MDDESYGVPIEEVRVKGRGKGRIGLTEAVRRSV
jgi:hypothetical protein